jgi:hypothetical protein
LYTTIIDEEGDKGACNAHLGIQITTEEEWVVKQLDGPVIGSSSISHGAQDHSNAGRPSALHGAWLLLARTGWLVLFIGMLVQFLVLLPNYVPSMERFCPQNCFFTSETAQIYSTHGVSVPLFAWTSLGIYVALVLVGSVLAGVLFWRRSSEWMVLLVAYFLVAYPISNLAEATTKSGLQSPISLILVAIPAITAFYAVFLLFPSGRFVPAWSWVFLLIWVVAITVGPIWPSVPYVLAYPICYGGAIVFQIYRYRRISTPVQRQQTKWVVFGFVASLLANQVFWLLPAAVGKVYQPIFYVVYLLVLLFVPVTFFIAVQRHRLYDIDVIINQGLVYGSLSAILAAIYLAGILGIQSLLALFSASQQPGPAQSPIALVVSTLVIAWLFQPLRHRLQQLIDRRFYRSKYDAEKALSTFAATVRSQVELATLDEQLVGIVEETLKPTMVVLWVRRKDIDPARVVPLQARPGDDGSNMAS